MVAALISPLTAVTTQLILSLKNMQNKYGTSNCYYKMTGVSELDDCIFNSVKGKGVSGERCEHVRCSAVTGKVNLPVLHIPCVKNQAHDPALQMCFSHAPLCAKTRL